MDKLIIGYFFGTIITFLFTFKAFLSIKNQNQIINPVIKLNNEDECTISELNEMLDNYECYVCHRYSEVDAEDSKCSECLNGDNYISYFGFVGIKSINYKKEVFKDAK